MAATSYLTIARDGETEIEVKRSRFLCTVERVESEEDARAVVERLRKQHRDARHHCSAFAIGPGRETTRSSDDGEPSGTAGAPMLEVMLGHEVSDVVAVVTRWFGGVLLGTGGLVRAYGDSVRSGLDAVGTLRRVLVIEHELVVPHTEAGRIDNELRSRGVQVLDAAYGAEVTLRLGVPADGQMSLAPVVAELTGGTGVLREAGSRWMDVPA
ncbi:hypothetical protein ASG73_08190 [Janibacter sp. Soil728]|uniref:YigZ family protein n=1 Tax=Janibacter sp. Soil728 TaxID=1736393 RepID=UPI0006FC4AF1|nr:YigZ family protein [Janibacter sp. Soil728]KRE37628.1 hypothetical protein ASG73_08190 [Janibacter sp. Soil728]